MNETPNSTPAGINLGEILYIVFRHKWKILLGCLLALGAAFAVPFVRPRQFESEARLYIRYVLESKTPTAAGDNDPRIRQPEARGDSIMRTELEILTSMDLISNVVDAIGFERILGKGVAKNEPALNRVRAATLILKQLALEVPKDSSIIRLTFHHSNPEVVQPVLNQLIASYIKKQAEIHAVGAFDEFLTQETDQRRSRVAQIEDELRKAKTKIGVISLEDTKKAYSDQLAKLQQTLLDAEAELAERSAAANSLAKTLHAPVVSLTNGATAMKELDAVAPEKLSEYRRVCALLETLAKTDGERSLMFTASNPLVLEVRAQIRSNEELKHKLEVENPGLIAEAKAVAAPVAGAPAVDPKADLNAEMAHVTGLESKVKMLRAQIDQIHTNVVALAQVEGNITDLERSLALESTNLASFAQGLQQSQLDEKLGAGKVANISTIEEPTSPVPAPSKTRKMMAMVFLGGVAAVFGLAFLLELYVDSSVKRPAEIESKLGLPLFISVPMLNGDRGPRRLGGKASRLLGGPGSGGNESGTTEQMEVEAPAPKTRGSEKPALAGGPQPAALPSLQPFSDALRDRLMTFFENRNMHHKPKLVAVTSCGKGSGVSSISAGLAASLSEIGDGNVLLVDMNLENGAAAHFHKGNLSCGLDEALEADKRDQAFVHNKLYRVSEVTNDKLPAALPKRFKSLVPRLKASDYDFIIFDMPPVSQISLTPRLSRFMDMVLMVVESEKTSRDVVKRASALLAESRANVGIVLNKQRRYVPRKLQQDL